MTASFLKCPESQKLRDESERYLGRRLAVKTLKENNSLKGGSAMCTEQEYTLYHFTVLPNQAAELFTFTMLDMISFRRI